MKHSIFSASAAHRWVACPGSIALSEGIPDTSSAAAQEGTMLHEVMDWCFRNDKDASDWSEGLLNDEQEDAVQECLDYVRDIPGSGRFYEMQVTYGRVINQDDELAFGTLDVAILDGTHLHVLDAKFGRRYVGAEDNYQMLLYAIGVVDALEVLGDEVKTLSLHIMQPRISGWGRAKPWEIKREDLAKHAKVFEAQSAKAYAAMENPTPTDPKWQAEYLNPTLEGCQWCRAKMQCPSFMQIAKDATKQVKTATMDEFDEVVKKVPEEDLAEAMSMVPFLEMFISEVNRETMSRLTNGDSVPGYKLVQGRAGNRRWEKEGEDLAKTLSALGLPDPYDKPKILSPAKVERQLIDLVAKDTGMKKTEAKIVVQEDINPLIVRSAPRPTVVTEDTPGTPWVASADISEF